MILRDIGIGSDFRLRKRAQTLSAATERSVVKHAMPIIECYRDELESRRIPTEKIEKVFLAVVPSTAVVADVEVKPLWKVVLLRRRFDVPRFLRSGVRGRHAILVDTIHRGLLAAARRYGFDGKPLHEIRKAVQQRGMHYAGCLSNARWNAQRSAFGQLCVYGTYQAGQVQLYVCDLHHGVVRGIYIRKHKFVSVAKITAILEQWQIKWKNADSLIVTGVGFKQIKNANSLMVKMVRTKRALRSVRVQDMPVVSRLRSNKPRDCSQFIRYLPPTKRASRAE